MRRRSFLSIGIIVLSAVPAMADNEQDLFLGHKVVCQATIKMKDGSTVQPGKQDRSGKSVMELANLLTDANSYGTSNLVRRSICTDANDSSTCFRYLYGTIPGVIQLTTSSVKDFDVSGVAFRAGTIETAGHRKFKFDGIEKAAGEGTVIDIRNAPERSEQTIGVLREPFVIKRNAAGSDLAQKYPNAAEVENRCTFDRRHQGIPIGRFESASYDDSQQSEFSTVFYFGYGLTADEAKKEALRKCKEAGAKDCQIGSTEQNDFKSPQD